MTRSEVLEILRKYKEENSIKYKIKSIGLFGSFAKGKENVQSDVDIVVEVIEPDLYLLVHIKDELEKMLNATVDIVRNREKMNPYLKKRIEKDAIYV
ncbi:MAG: nucleotidyltransferase [Chlorobi bacterium]|nr:nucleotidyltransferase [Chlorobiota bacterium]